VRADPALLALAIIANLASLVVKGIRWSLFLRPAGVDGLGQVVRTTFAGAALNNVLVANGGDAARVAAMARRGNVSSAAILATLAVDRFCDLVTYAALFVGAAIAVPLPPDLARWRLPGFAALGVLGGIAAALAWVGSRRDRTDNKLTADGGGVIARVGRYWHHLVTTSAAVVTGPRMVAAIGLSFAAWAGQWATFHYAAYATAFGTTASGSLIALLVVNASFLVRLTPGNVGVFQLLYALAAASDGVEKNNAVAVAFLIQLIQYVPVTVIGLLFAPSLVKSRPRSAFAPAVAPVGVQSDQTVGASGDIRGKS